jgi:hypothetical protein
MGISSTGYAKPDGCEPRGQATRLRTGIHYRFDIEASQVSCTQAADYLFDNYMRPNREARH